MSRFCPIVGILLLLLFFQPGAAYAVVTVTAPANGNCLDVKPGGFTTLDNIVITENLKGDFPSQVGTTFILTAPAGFEFNPGVGTVTGQTPVASGNITALSISVTSSTITVTMTVTGTNKWDEMTISGIQVRATSFNVTGHILRVSGSGGTSVVVGDAAGLGVSHGYLEGEKASSVYSIANGNWSNPAIWSGGFVPTCVDSILIRNTVNVDVASPAKTLIIEPTGILYADNAVTVSTSFVIQNGGFYYHNNLGVGSSTIFAGTESFSASSNIVVQRWHDVTVGFPAGVNGDFGNITFSQGASWSQDGLFAPARIKGTLTVTSGNITMDDGAGMTTSLTLNDVIVNNTGALIMASGPNRDLNLVTASFTDVSISGTRTVLIRNSQGNLTWTANGDVYISHNFSGYQHSGANPGVTTVQINGDLTVAGGQFTINANVDAPLTMTVTGTTLITGTPVYVRFIDSPTGSLNFTTTDFFIEAGNTTDLVGGNSPTGNAVVNVLNDFIMSGSSTLATFYNNAVSPGDITFNVGRDLQITGGQLILANTSGDVTVNVDRNLMITGADASLLGMQNTLSSGICSMDVTGYLQVEDGTFTMSIAHGDVNLNVVEDINMTNGYFYGINNTTYPANGDASLVCENINFNGGLFAFYNALSSTGATVTVTSNTDINLAFQNSTDTFALVALGGSNTAVLDLNIGYNLISTGNFPGAYFMSSASRGNETVDIGGSVYIFDGDIYFVGLETGLTASHDITMNVAGDIQIMGGHTRLSSGTGTATVTVTGNVMIQAGILSLKYAAGSGNMTVNGAYEQSGGTFNIHSGSSATTDISTVTVNGDFTMTNGTLNFDNTVASINLAEHILNIAGANYTLGGNAVITHANNLTTNYIFGQIRFTRAGITVYSRTSATNEIRHVKYTVNSGARVDATGSTNGFQMTSVASSSQTYNICLNIYGTLDMGSQVLTARPYTGYYSRLTVRNNGRYRLSHAGGLYSGSSTQASSIDGYISGNNRTNFTLESSSIVEYYGTGIMIVTGIPNGIANSNAQKYGFLEINHTGTPGASWVYPETSGEVFIRSRLVLTNGEFNLDDDHVTNGGGRIITLETGCTINRTNGFIRSETEDGSGLVAWSIPTNGTFLIPFGYDASTYIPFTYQQTAGSTGLLEVGTYRSLADNTPYPPTVTHVRDVNGVDNSANTVDRFWNIIAPGAATANLTFTFAPSEGTGITSPRAQLWEPVSTGWFPPTLGQSNPTSTTTQAGGITTLNNWWTLSSMNSPLPVELLSFEVYKRDQTVDLKWATATEIQNDYFTVERSRNGIEFAAIGTIAGAGNSNSTLYYQFTDENPMDGTNYYRIRQTDYDGTTTVSQTRFVNFGSVSSFNVYPNPIPLTGVLNIQSPGEGSFHISITDMTGKTVSSSEVVFRENSTIGIDLESTIKSNGVYLLKLTGPDINHQTKLIVK